MPLPAPSICRSMRSCRWPCPPAREPYNLDALWARIALEVDDAKLVQLDRLRLSPQRLSLRELADQLARTGRIVVKGIIEAR